MKGIENDKNFKKEFYLKIKNLFLNQVSNFHICIKTGNNYDYPRKNIDYKKALIEHFNDSSKPGIAIHTMFEGKTRFVVADFDYHDEIAKNIFHEDIFIKLKEIKNKSQQKFYIEITKRCGIHIWIFFEEPIDLNTANKMMEKMLAEFDLLSHSRFDDIRPKKNQKGQGLLIHLPFDAYFRENGKTCFLDDNFNPITDFNNYLNFLHNIKKITQTEEKNNKLQDNSLKDIERIISKGIISVNNSRYNLNQINKSIFFKWCMENPSLVNFYDWIALITNLLPLGPIGEELIHTISERDEKRYDFNNTEKQIQSVKSRNLKPYTYEYIKSNGNFQEHVFSNIRAPIVELVYRKYEHISYPLLMVLEKPLFKDVILRNILIELILKEQKGKKKVLMGYKQWKLYPGEILLSQRRLAELVNLPNTTLQRKIQVLEENKILRKYEISGKIIIKITAVYYDPRLGMEIPLYVGQSRKWVDL